MSDYIRLKQGLDLPIKGAAALEVTKTVEPDLVAVKPSDWRGVIPRLLVREGDAVKAGTPLFADKQNPDIVFCSPVSGTVNAIVRGDKRKLLAVTVKADGKNESLKFSAPEVSKANRNAVRELLLQSGLWACIKQRPYGTVANPQATPKAVFISGFNTAPLGADLDFVLAGELPCIQAGIDALAKLTDGGVHLSLNRENCGKTEFRNLKNVITHVFAGAHPAGNVGIQINHISPINKGETIWTVNLQDVAAIGRLFLNGVYDTAKTIAVAGPAVKNPSYVKVPQGVAISALAEYFDNSEGDIRIISGDVLSGTTVGNDGFLGFYDNLVSVVPEGNYHEMFGWVKPFRCKKFSFSRTYWSWLCGKGRKYQMDTNTNGGQRAFFVSDVYGKVLPMDIYPVYLFKAILAGDIEKMEQLGIYEVIEEDVALCEYVCPSKIEIQNIVGKGIDLMLKEMA
ncbi:MAG: Na(+)-translocating NADH-quinone reductase subunit A [Bacteroidales bacterium]|nr:Na(+)-translocating NADH-quinone reductase subunit A [Candidatus Cacconaster scatequi]